MFTIYNRITHGETEITEEQGTKICQEAPYHTGPYGYAGHRISEVLYVEDDVEDSEPVLVAIRLDGEWYLIPENQIVHMESELSRHAYEEAE